MTQINHNSLWMHQAIIVRNPFATHSFRNVILDVSDGRLTARQELEKLRTRKVITQEEIENLTAMIDSPDEENLVIVKCIIEEKKKMKTRREKLMFWRR